MQFPTINYSKVWTQERKLREIIINKKKIIINAQKTFKVELLKAGSSWDHGQEQTLRYRTTYIQKGFRLLHSSLSETKCKARRTHTHTQTVARSDEERSRRKT